MDSIPPNNEKELCLAIAEGDEVAFRELFHLYLPKLHPMILKITRIESVTEDILQDTFLRLWINRDRLPGITNPWAWVLQIAYYQAFTFLRKKITHQKAVDRLTGKAGIETLRSTTEEVVAFKTMQELVRRAISRMPAQQKKVYLLSREQGLKTSEIATRLTLSEQTVKNTLGRALKFIRGCIEQSGHTIISIMILVLQYFGY